MITEPQPVTSFCDAKIGVHAMQHVRSTLKPGDAVQFKVLRKGTGRNADWISAYPAGTLPMR